MKKKKKIKRYFQNNAFFQVFCIVLLVMGISELISGVMLSINPPSNKFSLGASAFFSSFLFLSPIIPLESRIIHMDDEKIWMNATPVPKLIREQFDAKILFSEIVDISLVHSTKTSQAKPTFFESGKARKTIKTYLVFSKKNGRKVRMNVSYFTKDYLMEIISEVILRVNAVGNNYEGHDAIWIFNNVKKQ